MASETESMRAPAARRWRPWVAAVVLIGLLYVGASRVGPAPPIGPFIDPSNGVWAIEGDARPGNEARVTIAALDSTVTVQYDVRGVPHITAATERDAYRALGY